MPCLEFRPLFSVAAHHHHRPPIPIQNSNRQKPLVNFIFILAEKAENGNYLLWTCTPKKIHLSLSVPLAASLHCPLPLPSSSRPVHISTFVTSHNTHIFLMIIYLHHYHHAHNNMFMLIPFTPSFHPFYFIRPSHKELQLTFHFVSFAQPNKPEKTNGTSHYHPHHRTYAHHIHKHTTTTNLYLHTYMIITHTHLRS